ncbi:rCG23771 [Rattus norvegicus]|uniref:RCG23771 n=1 Tax=Rattus norvegicus TaxID=10116 RepID=A6JVR7_RAT|nr:rCG23771 [Rattus norvegicus]
MPTAVVMLLSRDEPMRTLILFIHSEMVRLLGRKNGSSLKEIDLQTHTHTHTHAHTHTHIFFLYVSTCTTCVLGV